MKWLKEPDRKEFKYEGFDCLIQRAKVTGSLCGYVAVPKGHPWFEKSYNDIEADVHGGLTYANHCSGHICHKSDDNSDDKVWWVGFDCAHAWDLSPKLMFGRLQDCVYRDIEYVEGQVKHLADQARSA